MVATLQHFADELARTLEIVVEVEQQICQALVPLLQVQQRVARGLPIQVLSFFTNLGHCSEPRQPRHAPRDGGAQRIDGLDTQLGWVFEKIPTEPVLVIQNIARDL
ncbi:MAG TPA: hypothetical protein VFW23_07415, partial [Tepidisphaeraceae bacterium]|nr:hypothetical protein [Tepidisphaeraceae bacterium]